MDVDNSDKPHRVVFQHGTQNRTRIFANKAAAEAFAPGVTGKVQLATERVEGSTRKCFQESPQRNKCKCGKSKILADEHCFVCRGQDSITAAKVNRFSSFGKSSTPTFVK